MTVMVTFEAEGVHDPLEIVQVNTYVPLTSPEINEVGDAELAIVAELGPETCVHTPVPVTGVLAAMVAVVSPQKVWFGPAFAVVGIAELITITVLVEAVHVPLEMLHWRTYVPMIIPVVVVVAEFGLVMVGELGPLIILHVPVPVKGTFPAITVVATLQRFCVGPAFEVVGGAELVMVTVLVEAGQVPLTILHWNI